LKLKNQKQKINNIEKVPWKKSGRKKWHNTAVRNKNLKYNCNSLFVKNQTKNATKLEKTARKSRFSGLTNKTR